MDNNTEKDFSVESYSVIKNNSNFEFAGSSLEDKGTRGPKIEYFNCWEDGKYSPNECPYQQGTTLVMGHYQWVSIKQTTLSFQK